MTSIKTTSRPNYQATRNSDGSFNIPNTPLGDFKNIPYIGEYENYREMDKDAAEFMRKEYAATGYVCRVEHNKENEFVFFYPMGLERQDEYIII